jgi:hypothetical protein
VDYNVFTIRPNSTGDLAVEPILVAAPGHVPAGLIAGRELEISAGGDEGFASWISCEGYPANPVIVWTWIWGPVETNIPKEVHITRIQLKADGLIHVIGTNDYMLPAGQPSGLSPATAPACGVDWQLWD